VKHNAGKFSIKTIAFQFETFQSKVIHGSHNSRILGLSLGSLRKFSQFNVLFVVNHKMYYKEDGDGLFPSLGHVSVISPKQVYDPKLAYVCFNHLHCLICVNYLSMKFS
jgi:hypothetical protein